MRKTIVTKEQECYIVNHWHNDSITKITEKLKIDKGVIVSTAKNLGLDSKYEILKKRASKIDDYLVKHWKTDKLVDIAFVLKEKRWIIEERARALGLNKKREAYIGNKIGKLYVKALLSDGKKYECLCECGKTVYVNPQYLYDSKTPSCKSCSRPSRRPSSWRNIKGKRFGRLMVLEEYPKRNISQSSKWLCKCDCGRTKIIDGTSLRSGMSRSCGCLQKEMLSGENSRFWKGGVSEENLRIRSSYRYLKWAAEVKTRDFHTCQCCGHKTQEKWGLHSHHILSFMDNPSVRFDIDNGITLCGQCHDEFHEMCGNGKNTKEQLVGFIELKRDYLLTTFGQLPLLPLIDKILSAK